MKSTDDSNPQVALSDIGSGWHAARRYVIGMVALLVVSTGFYMVVQGPIHGVGSAQECAEAYAKATTHQDSVSVDLLSYPDTTGHGLNTRCGFVRAEQSTSASALTPNTHD